MAIIDIKAEITGNVWKVLARPGQKVEEDQAIVMMESMKMEIPVSAPEPGTVREILGFRGRDRHRGKCRRAPRSVSGALATPIGR